jgi:hypothetical protein
MRAVWTIVFGAVGWVGGTNAAGAQGTTYTIPGISAWTTAKTYAFEFAPERNTGETVTQPFDGMNTRLRRTATVLFKPVTVTVAQVVGGQPSVNQGERSTIFRMFAGRTLQPGWTVKSVDIGGNFSYVQQPRLGTSDLSFRVKLSPGGTATLRNVVLTGPAGADWKDAFSAPVRKDYVINGVVAWNAAKKYGFQFYPSDRNGNTDRVTTPYDGVLTMLTAGKTLSWLNCTPRPGFSDLCIVAQIAGGNLSVPVHPIGYTARFTMFAGKKLAPGWQVKAVSISNGTFIRQAATGSGDLSFVVQLASTPTQAATAIVKSITLEGPSNAASFEDAFKNAP